MKIIIPMAGLGSRFFNAGFTSPKPLIQVLDSTIVEHSVRSLNIDGDYIFITRKFKNHDHNHKLEKILRTIKPKCKIVTVDKLTSGAAETCLLAKEYIDPEDELIITNCDQYLDWDPQKFLEKSRRFDASLLTYGSKDPKNSFVLTDSREKVLRIAEKEAISDTALVGVHYWKKGKMFLSTADKLVQSVHGSKVESYVSLTYNYLIEEGKQITIHGISPGRFYSLGTPEDLKKFKGIRAEFTTKKPSTIFCDIDGTIMYHHHSYSSVFSNEPNILPGVMDKFDEWDSKGHKIILVTARKESARKLTEAALEKLSIPYDMLIMGVTSGQRVLINDIVDDSQPPRSKSVNVITNEGFNNTEWSKVGL